MLKIDIEKPLFGSEKEMLLEVNIEIKSGEILALSGESGSGKTTLLRILAGLEEAKGTIVFDNEMWLDEKSILPPQKRKIGFVFQDYALFENMSVLQNLLYVKKDRALAHKLLYITQLHNLQERLPQSLSGGQKQRVALCRAMMNAPKLLLLDEPLSAIDPKLRNTLQDEIVKLHEAFGTTTIFTSHDSQEIYKLANRVLVLKKGKIVEDGTKDILIEEKLKVKDIQKINNVYRGTVNVAGILREVEFEIPLSD